MIIIVAIGYTDFRYVYRDDSILKYKVGEGVYAGIYTTEARSCDLPEMERYLNETIGENDIYAFRDNVPFAYLMMHHGQVCEVSTWDILQYTYKRNSPSILFEYYKGRDMIPDKIIYIDFGRDANLSIEDPAFKYNQFVNTYYDRRDDFELNDTFYHVITYEYNGSFDGNYDYWYEKFYKLN